MPAKQLVRQCGNSGAKLGQPVRAVPPSTGRCDPNRSLRPAPSGPRDAAGLPDANGIDLRGRSGVEARHPDSADFRRGWRLPCVSSVTWPVCVSGAGAAASVPGRPPIPVLPLRGRFRPRTLDSPPNSRHLKETACEQACVSGAQDPLGGGKASASIPHTTPPAIPSARPHPPAPGGTARPGRAGATRRGWSCRRSSADQTSPRCAADSTASNSSARGCAKDPLRGRCARTPGGGCAPR